MTLSIDGASVSFDAFDFSVCQYLSESRFVRKWRLFDESASIVFLIETRTDEYLIFTGGTVQKKRQVSPYDLCVVGKMLCVDGKFRVHCTRLAMKNKHSGSPVTFACFSLLVLKNWNTQLVSTHRQDKRTGFGAASRSACLFVYFCQRPYRACLPNESKCTRAENDAGCSVWIVQKILSGFPSALFTK